MSISSQFLLGHLDLVNWVVDTQPLDIPTPGTYPLPGHIYPQKGPGTRHAHPQKGHVTRDNHPHVDRQIPVKTLPFCNFVGGQQKYPHELHVFQIQDSSSEDENPSHIDKPSSSELSTAVTTFKKGKKLKQKSYKY